MHLFTNLCRETGSSFRTIVETNEVNVIPALLSFMYLFFRMLCSPSTAFVVVILALYYIKEHTSYMALYYSNEHTSYMALYYIKEMKIVCITNVCYVCTIK